jgi:hypothetical protein
MPPSRRTLLISLGGLLFGSGALAGASAFNESTQPDADMRVVAAEGFITLEVGPDSQQDQIVRKPNGELGVDFAGPSESDGVQPQATYQLGGIDLGEQPVADAINGDPNGVVSASGYPSPIGRGTAQTDAAIIVRNDANELVGVTVDFVPGGNFPSNGRVFVVTHDKGQAVGGTDTHAKLFGQSGKIAASPNSEQYRPVHSGEELGVSVWIFTGTDQTADMSGTLEFRADDANSVTVGDSS